MAQVASQHTVLPFSGSLRGGDGGDGGGGGGGADRMLHEKANTIVMQYSKDMKKKSVSQAHQHGLWIESTFFSLSGCGKRK